MVQCKHSFANSFLRGITLHSPFLFLKEGFKCRMKMLYDGLTSWRMRNTGEMVNTPKLQELLGALIYVTSIIHNCYQSLQHVIYLRLQKHHTSVKLHLLCFLLHVQKPNRF